MTAPLVAGTIPALAQAYADAYAAGQYLHHLANEADDDPQMLSEAYREQDRAVALAVDLARTPALTANDLLMKIVALIGQPYVSYPGCERLIREEAERILAA